MPWGRGDERVPCEGTPCRILSLSHAYAHQHRGEDAPPFVLCLVIDVFSAATFVCYIGGRIARRRRGGVTLQQKLLQAPPGQALQWRRLGPYPLHGHIGFLYSRGWPAAWTPHRYRLSCKSSRSSVVRSRHDSGRSSSRARAMRSRMMSARF
jgi:hypothetical protein